MKKNIVNHVWPAARDPAGYPKRTRLHKRVVIIGHTSGIGAKFFDYYCRAEAEVLGFSRSGGYDIGTDEARKRILLECVDADIFINNAFHPTGQLEMLKEIVELWGLTDKKIINISSKISLVKEPKEKTEMIFLAKKELNEFIRSRLFRPSPRILNVIAGLVNTETSSKIYESPAAIDAEELVNFVGWLIERETIHVQEMVIDSPGLDWSSIKTKDANWSYEKWKFIDTP